MPTLNPRVNVTLSPSLDALLGQLAELQSSSKSQVLRELLQAAEPALRRAVTLMAAASRASDQVKRGLAEALGAGMNAIEGQLEHELGDLDRYGPDLVAAMEGGSPLMTDRVAARARKPKASAAPAPKTVRKRVTTPVALTGGLGRSGTRGQKPGKVSSKGSGRGRV